MQLVFNERKATQAATHLLRLRGGRMSYLKLIKLLYRADREALLRWGRPITTDRYVSMDHGPVVSRIYNLMNVEPDPVEAHSIWHESIRRNGWDVEVQPNSVIENDELSEAEESVLNEIFAEHGGKNRWQVRDESHDLPEWKDPEGSSIPINYEDIFDAGVKDEFQKAELADNLKAWIAADTILSHCR